MGVFNMLPMSERVLGFYFIKLIWLRKTTLLILLLNACILGFFARLGYQQFIYLQAQNISGLSVFNEIILPLAGLTIACQLLMSLLVAAQLTPSFYLAGQANLLQQSSLAIQRISISLFLPVMLFGLWPLFNFCWISFLFIFYSDIDLSRLSLVILGLFLINSISSLIIFIASLRAKNLLIALLQSIVVIGTLLLIEISVSYVQTNASAGFGWRGIFLPFFALREGLFVYADMVSYLAWFILLSSLILLIQSKNLKNRRRSVFAGVIAALILLAAGYVPGQIDLTLSKRNSPSQELLLLLDKRQYKLQIMAVINQETSRDEIMRGFKIIQQAIPDSQIRFQSIQSLGPDYRGAGEHLQFKMGELSQTITYPFDHQVKQVFESAIHQMLKRKKYWITFIEGHDEASIFAKKTSDLGGLHKTLIDMGWSVASQNLLDIPLISDNTGLLVIASSKNKWLTSEEDIVLNYLRKGGHLLILRDPDSVIPSRIEAFVGISTYPGTLVDWNGYQSGTPHPSVVIVTAMGKHPIAKNINSFLAFPWASGLKVTSAHDDPNVFFESIVMSHKNVWNELDISGEQLVFEQDKGELQQSFILAMSRYNTQNRQKIIVIGDSHFVSDSAINNSANKQFALNIIDWLSIDDVNVYDKNQSPVKRKDNYIEPSPIGHFLMNWLFCVLVPLLVFIMWMALSVRRNKLFKRTF